MSDQQSLPTDPAPAGDKAPKAPAAKKAAPKKSAPRRKKSTPRGGRPSKDQFRKLCAEMIDQLVGVMVLAGFTNPRLAYDAQVIQSQADALTDELFSRGWDATAGRTNRFGQWIERANTVGEWGRTVSLLVGIGIPLAANHGLVPTETVALVNLTRSEPLPIPDPVERKPRKPRRSPDVEHLDVNDGDEAGAADEAETLDRLGWPATG